MKKNELNEIFTTRHSIDRTLQRLPKSILVKNKSTFKDLKALLSKVELPSGDFLINFYELDNYYFSGVIRDNTYVTCLYKDKENFKSAGLFSVLNFQNLCNVLDFIRSKDFPSGKYLYKYQDNSKNKPFFFVVDDNVILKTIAKDNLKNFKEYKWYNFE
jgi:hypothetical protein